MSRPRPDLIQASLEFDDLTFATIHDFAQRIASLGSSIMAPDRAAVVITTDPFERGLSSQTPQRHTATITWEEEN